MKQQRLPEGRHGFGEHPVSARRQKPMQSVVFASGGPIDETIRIRDLHQFEIKLHYPLAREIAAVAYDLECYIFVPHSLGMNRANYSKARFYDDLQTHIRFKTPSIPLTAIKGGQDSPLIKLQASAVPLQRGGHDANVGAFEYRLKLFCCILQSSLRDFVTFIGETTDPDDRGRLVQQYLGNAAAITDTYRALRSKIFLPAVPRQACAIYAFGDEYVSLLVERNLYDLLGRLRETDASGLRTSQRTIMNLVAREVRYRESRQYPSIPTDKNDNEQLIFRRNVLKKYMHNVLFLDTRTRQEGKVIEHGLFGIAAGISMLFATVVLFLSQSFYGPLTLPVFLALVIGYMFKDRIKEMLRVYFSRIVSSVLFDHKTRIYSDPHHPIGHCRESFDFIDEAKVPDRIMKIRDRDHITEIESEWVSESVLRYRKRIKLSSRAISSAYRDIDTDGINDIMRFNVADFTRRMGNPRKELFVLGEDDYRRVKAERVYHINMILRYGGGDRVRYKRLRIVLNRRKIKRIETVSVEDE
jgi:hypothetical protein